ncbi:MAG: hypothetical protein AB7G62_13855 [Magnetospirillum sp.]
MNRIGDLKTMMAALAAIIIISFTIAFHPERLTNSAAVISALLLISAIIFIYFWSTNKQRGLPFFSFIGVFYLIFYAIQPFFVDFTWQDRAIQLYADAIPLPSNLLTASSMGIMAGGILILFAAMTIGTKLFRRYLPRITFIEGQDVITAVVLAVTFLGLHFTWLLLDGQRMQALFNALALAGFAIPWLLFLGGRLRWYWLIPFFAVLLPAKIGLGLASGSFTKALFLPAFLVFLYFSEKPRAATICLILGMVFISLAYRPYREFRDHVWLTKQFGYQPDFMDYVTLLKAGIDKGFNGTMQLERDPTAPTSPSALIPLREAAKRTNAAVLFAQIYETTPSLVPFWNGESLRPLLTSLVPRFLYPQKPEERFGNEFGHRYFLLRADDMNMSVNLPWLVEAYANFGLPGIVGVMTLAGLFLAALNTLINPSSLHPINSAIGGAVLFPLVNQESNISLTCGNVPLLIVTLYVMARLIDWSIRQCRQRWPG